MASFNGRPCTVEIVDETVLRVSLDDFSFELKPGDCEIAHSLKSIELTAADGILALSRSEYRALRLRHPQSDVLRGAALWGTAVALFIALLLIGPRLAAGPLSRMISLETEKRWFPSTSKTRDPSLEILLAEIPGATDIHVSLREFTDVNAFALPGAVIELTDGAVCFSKSPGEIVGILGHEAGHVRRRHVLRSVISDVGAQTLIGAFLSGGFSTTFAGSVALRQFSIDDELEADRDAADALFAAGIAPAVLGDFFERLAKDKPIAFEALLSDHPLTRSRIAYFRSRKAPAVGSDPRASEARLKAWNALRAARCNKPTLPI
jgi:Zn-dependent protease with chaperone function